MESENLKGIPNLKRFSDEQLSLELARREQVRKDRVLKASHNEPIQTKIDSLQQAIEELKKQLI